MQSTRIWDLATRLFHWALAGLILVNLIIGGDDAGLFGLHVYLGYAALLLVLFRLLWGFVGTRHARFADFLVSPGRALAYAGDLLRGRVEPHAGHTPLGGYMIVALLLTVLATAATGLLGGLGSHAAEEVHEVLPNLLWALIALHLAGVALHSWRARENIVRAMVTGHKALPSELSTTAAVRPAPLRAAATAAVVLVAGGLAAQQLDLAALAKGDEGGERGTVIEDGEGGEGGQED